MNSWKSVFAVTLGVYAVLVTGCGSQRPEGIPELFPAKVTVKEGASPIADASVFLVLQGGDSGSWAANGVTDTNGVAVINTSQGAWKSKGAPAGDYKIFITKRPDIEEDPVPDEIREDSDAMQRFSAEQLRKLQAAPKIIPDILADPSKSPLKMSVAKGGTAELTVDVSEHK